jgi:trans-aconitate 2-methyltransferase
MPTWDAKLYLQFADERTQPARDLIARIALDAPRRIVDLGCGPGNSTALLHARWPGADIIGLDSSPEMIAAASQAGSGYSWQTGDAATWTAPVPFDLVFSNAALQWVPNHARVFTHLIGQVSRPGVLAVQMPANYYSPVHLLMREIARDSAWSHLLEPAAQAIRVETASFYYDILQPFAKKLDLWETEYNHIVDSPQAILAWIRGTGLRPFLEALETEAQRRRFQEMLLDAVRKAYPRQKDGRVLFPFRRLFLVAYC